MENTNLKKIVNLEGDFFVNTGVKTAILFFVNDGNNTTEVEFSSVSLENNEVIENSIIKTDIKDIQKNNYSLFVNKYTTNPIEKIEGLVYKKLGEVCDIKIGGTPNRKKNEYYTNGNNIWVSVKELNGNLVYDSKEKINDHGVKNSNVKLLPKDTILFSFKLSIGKLGIAAVPLYTNEAIAGLNSKNNDIILNKYLYYYLKNNDFKNIAHGSIGTGSLNSKDIANIEIPIPSLEKQKEIVKYLDFYDTSTKTSEQKIKELKKANDMHVNIKLTGADCEHKKLGEVCELKTGTYITKTMKNNGPYPVYGGGDPSYYIDKYNRKDEIIVAKDGVSLNCVRYEEKPFFLNHHGWTIDCFEQILKKYLYFYLKSIQNKIFELASGSAQLGINQTNFLSVEVPVPSIEKQKEIVAYCEQNENTIKQLEEDIENNKKLGIEFMSNCLKSLEKNSEQKKNKKNKKNKAQAKSSKKDKTIIEV